MALRWPREAALASANAGRAARRSARRFGRARQGRDRPRYVAPPAGRPRRPPHGAGRARGWSAHHLRRLRTVGARALAPHWRAARASQAAQAHHQLRALSCAPANSGLDPTNQAASGSARDVAERAAATRRVHRRSGAAPSHRRRRRALARPRRKAQRKISRSSPSIRWSTKRSVGEKLGAASFSFSK
jgi:hypothetical protein